MTNNPRPAPGCRCPIHELEELIIEFVEMLISPEKAKELEKFAGVPAEQTDPTLARIAMVASALATIAYRHPAVDSEAVLGAFASSWNKLCVRQAEFEADPEKFLEKEKLNQKLDCFKS